MTTLALRRRNYVAVSLCLLGINGVTFWLSRVVLAANWKLIAEPSEIGPGSGLAFCWTVIMVPNCSLKLKGLSPKILALSAGK